MCVRLLRITAALVGLLVVGAACTADNGGGPDDAAEPAIVRVTPQPTGTDQPTPAPEGRVENKYDLEVAWCFNQYELLVEQTGETRDITTVVDCRRPHDGEVYDSFFHPAEGGAPFPGNREMERWANTSCYQSFGTFVGVDYELSELEIGTIRPTEETWTGEGVHREVTCYVYAPGARLSGPMAGSEF